MTGTPVTGTAAAGTAAAGTPRAWATRAGLVAVLVIAAQLLWRTVLLGHGYFSQDDFLAITSTATRDGLAVLGGDYAGGFSPGGSAVVWAVSGLAPLNWPLAAAVVLALQTGATAMMWLVLTHLLGDRWLRVPLLVLFAYAPLTLWSTQWWVLGIEYWSATLLLLVAVWAVLTGIRGDDPRRALVAVGAVALAVLFDERAVLYPVVLAGVALLAASGATVRQRLARVVGDLPQLWVGLILIVAGYAVLRWQAAPISLDLGDQLGDVVTGYLRHGLAEVFGGPWTGSLPAHAYLVPISWIVALNGALLLGLVGVTTQHGGATARIGWGMLVVFVGGSVGVLALTGRADLVASLGLEHRFGAELAAVVTLALAGALSGVAFPDLSARGRRWTASGLETGTAALASLALIVSAAVSTGFLASNLYHRDDRHYVETARAALRADRQVVLLDGGVPDGVISAWYGARARVSTVLGQAPERPVFDLPSHSLRMVRDDGSLAPIVLEGPVRTEPSDDKACGYPVRTGGTLIPMQAEVPDGRWVLRLGYYTSADGFAVLDVVGTRYRFAVRSGLHALDVVVNGGFTNFRVTLESAATTLCLTDAAAGVPRPEPR
ncbi:hypothetical protein EFK50_02820 [Nocardioides marmoriginsengisoli]|uniref:Glycosyltransferase RgtA/B/C/D-like domain-containing protein n=2 Tax=Nocardioides marmoriginsengisoli TaxID=661483 RepID=A0A3N0CNQ0_9ACTN|nr:hypothetical protein EFK50_02820 [Nocardioides marmoriginsengisoli]